ADDTIAFLQKHPPPVSWQGITTSCLQPWRRKNTLLKDYKSSGKSSVFVDNSIGEQNEELGGLITRFCDRSEKCGYLSYRRRSPLRDKSPPRYEARRSRCRSKFWEFTVEVPESLNASSLFLPLHNAVAGARLTSCLSTTSRSCISLSQGILYCTSSGL
ncbi:hypothetical protein Tco_1248315, partial [Tanacetum coccineum]